MDNKSNSGASCGFEEHSFSRVVEKEILSQEVEKLMVNKKKKKGKKVEFYQNFDRLDEEREDVKDGF